MILYPTRARGIIVNYFDWKVFVLSESVYLKSPLTVDDLWHHVCVTWTSVDGKIRLFFDGVLNSAPMEHNGVVIAGGGNLTIGQRSTSIGRNYSPQHSFRGKLAKFNLWSRVLNENVIVALFRNPAAEIGDLISWRNIRTASIFGNVVVKNVSTIPFTGKII